MTILVCIHYHGRGGEEFRHQFSGLIQDELPPIQLGPRPLPEGRSAAIESH